MKKTRLISYAYALLMVSGVLFSCQKTEHEALDLPQSSATQPIDPQHLEAIARMGYDTEGIRRLDVGYLVEGDILITEENLQDTASAPESEQMEDEAGNPVVSAPGRLTRQDYYGEYNKVTIPSNGQPKVIRVGVHPNLKGWDQGIKDAITEWNKIPGFGIKLEFTNLSGSANIYFNPIEDGDNVFGRAYIPSNGNPGYQITINTQYKGRWSSNKQTAAHLIGHALGFGHPHGANEHYDLEERNPPTVEHIPGTPTNDQRSVMTWSGLTANWTGFTEGDILAAQILYPLNAPTPPPTPVDPVKNVVINGPATANVGGNMTFSITGYPTNVESVSWYRTTQRAVTVSNATSQYNTGTWKAIGPGTMTVECRIKIKGDSKIYSKTKAVTIKSDIQGPTGTMYDVLTYDFSAPHVPSENSTVTWSGDGVEIAEGQGTANVKVKFTKAGDAITLKAHVVDNEYGADFEISKTLKVDKLYFSMRARVNPGLYDRYYYVNDQTYFDFYTIDPGFNISLRNVELLNADPNVVFDGSRYVAYPGATPDKNKFNIKFLKDGQYTLSIKVDAEITHQGSAFPWSQIIEVPLRVVDRTKVYQPTPFGGILPFHLGIMNAGMPFSMLPGDRSVYGLNYVFTWENMPPREDFDGILYLSVQIEPVEERGGQYYPIDRIQELYSAKLDMNDHNNDYHMMWVNYNQKKCEIFSFLDIPRECPWGIPWDAVKWRLTIAVIEYGKGVVSSAQTVCTIRTSGPWFPPEFTD